MSGSYVLLAGPATRSRQRAVAALRAAGYRVVEAANGAQVVERTSSSQPDLVIFDLSMAVQHAQEFGEAQRACDALQSTPTLVIVTPVAGAIPDGLPSADDVLESSYDNGRLLAAVRQFCLPALTPGDAAAAIAASFTSQAGEVACPMHAPPVGSSRWAEEGWKPLGSRDGNEVKTCHRCASREPFHRRTGPFRPLDRPS